MSWKITLGKPDHSYIIGKRWIKKNIPKSQRYTKSLHQENSCPGSIYDIGEHYLPDQPNKRIKLWVCMETGKLMTKAPKLSVRPETKPPKPKPQVIQKVKPKAKPKTKPTIVKPTPEPETVPEPTPAAPSTPQYDKSSSVSEVKGIGKAVFEKLSAAGINTIEDLLSKHSQEIATLIGRKSDTQIKKWQDTAKEMTS